MRILYVHNINRVAQIHAEELAQRNHLTKIYEPNLTGGLAPLPIKLLKMPERILDLRHIIGKLSSKHFDIVHIHWASYGVLGLVSHIPFIVECHGLDVEHRLAHPFFRSILKPILCQAAAVICITPDLLPIVQTVRPDVLFLPGPIDIQRFSQASEAVLPRERPWSVLFFTRLDPKKGPQIGVEGIRRFAQRHPDTHVRLLDWGILKEEYKRYYSKYFEFIPPVSSDQVKNLILSADVVVGQFASGALGLSELQVMSCAKPLVCSFAFPAAYPSPPPLYQANTPEEVDEQLEYLFQHPEEGAATGKKAQEWVIAYHDSRILSAKLETLYCSILGRTDSLQYVA